MNIYTKNAQLNYAMQSGACRPSGTAAAAAQAAARAAASGAEIGLTAWVGDVQARNILK